jgi:hypothetical protein
LDWNRSKQTEDSNFSDQIIIRKESNGAFFIKKNFQTGAAVYRAGYHSPRPRKQSHQNKVAGPTTA